MGGGRDDFVDDGFVDDVPSEAPVLHCEHRRGETPGAGGGAAHHQREAVAPKTFLKRNKIQG